MKTVIDRKGSSIFSLLQRLRVIIWVSAFFISFFTCCTPVMIKSAERYIMVPETVVNGYELIAYAPVAAILIIAAPLFSAALHTSMLTINRKVLSYFALLFSYIITCFVLYITAAKDMMIGENCMVMCLEGMWIVLMVFFLHLLIGMIPVVALWIQEREG